MMKMKLAHLHGRDTRCKENIPISPSLVALRRGLDALPAPHQATIEFNLTPNSKPSSTRGEITNTSTCSGFTILPCCFVSCQALVSLTLPLSCLLLCLHSELTSASFTSARTLLDFQIAHICHFQWSLHMNRLGRHSRYRSHISNCNNEDRHLPFTTPHSRGETHHMHQGAICFRDGQIRRSYKVMVL